MVDFLSSVGLVGLCAAEFDPTIFKVVLAVTSACFVGFLITAMWSVAESFVYRHHQGSKWLWDVLSGHWKRTMGLLPFRVAIETVHGILSLAISAWHGVVGIMSRLDESVKRFFHHSGRRSTLIPMAVTNTLRIMIPSALGFPAVNHGHGLEAVHDDERRAVDHQDVKLIHVNEKVKNAARFWQRPHNGEGVPLHAIKTHAHVGTIR